MNVIGVFRGFFDNIGGLMDFITSDITLNFGFTSVTISPLTMFGASMGLFLSVCLALHVAHLINVVAG